MANRKRKAAIDLDEDIKVGEGDETISDWYHRFDVIEEIDWRLRKLPPEFEWEKVGRGLTAYPEFLGALERLEGKRDLHVWASAWQRYRSQ
jgi:hypothetical protein